MTADRPTGTGPVPAPEYTLERPPGCLVEECDNPRTWMRGVCKQCFMALRRSGDLDAVALPPAGKRQRVVGERWMDYAGYVMVCTDTGVEPEHRNVMSRHLGRPLVRGENVHHINGDRADNRLENLEPWFSAQPAGQRIDQLLPYVATFHREAVLDLIAKAGDAA